MRRTRPGSWRALNVEKARVKALATWRGYSSLVKEMNRIIRTRETIDLCELAEKHGVNVNLAFTIALKIVREGRAVIRYRKLPGIITAEGLKLHV